MNRRWPSFLIAGTFLCAAACGGPTSSVLPSAHLNNVVREALVSLVHRRLRLLRALSAGGGSSGSVLEDPHRGPAALPKNVRSITLNVGFDYDRPDQVIENRDGRVVQQHLSCPAVVR